MKGAQNFANCDKSRPKNNSALGYTKRKQQHLF